MSYRLVFACIAFSLVFTAALLYAVRGLPAAPAPNTYFIEMAGGDSYRIDASSIASNGFCTEVRKGAEVVAVICGQHTAAKQDKE